MKKKITPEIKAKVAAMHIGSNVYLRKTGIRSLRSVSIECDEYECTLATLPLNENSDYDKIYSIHDVSVLLKPLAKISDEHAIECMSIYKCINTEEGFITCESRNKGKIKRAIIGMIIHIQPVSDYLRSLGYAVPFTTSIDGQPVTFTVDQLVQAGVFKLEGEQP